MAPLTIGQSYGNDLNLTVGTQTNTGVANVPANSDTLTGTLETDNMEQKPNANAVSGVVAATAAGNLGAVTDNTGLETTAKSPQQVTNPNLLGDVIEPPAQEEAVMPLEMEDAVAPAEPDASEQPTEEAPQETPDAGAQEGEPANPEDPSEAGEPVAEPAEPTAVLQDAIFDPSEHEPEEVLAYLAEAEPDEKARVLQAEIDGKMRQAVIGAQ